MSENVLPFPGRRDFLSSGQEVFRQGKQHYHLGCALRDYPVGQVVAELAEGYRAENHSLTPSQAVLLAACVVEGFQSNAAGQAVPQKARQRLDARKRASGGRLAE